MKTATTAQTKYIWSLAEKVGLNEYETLRTFNGMICGSSAKQSDQLTTDEASKVIDTLKFMVSDNEFGTKWINAVERNLKVRMSD